jgi:Arc/MetJ-type ribon-helix-helix transcriptional regulator
MMTISGDSIMQIDIPSELQPFFDQEFATGRYSRREDVLIQALQLLREERSQAVEGITQGLEDLSAGRIQSLEIAFSEIRGQIDVPQTE